MLKLHKESHLDHNLTSAHLAFIVEYFKGKNEPFIATINLPDELPGLPCDLHGPIMGDEPVPSAHVVNWRRNGRAYASRLCARASRLDRRVTVIAGAHDGEPCVLFTAYGGPLAPREPGDLESAGGLGSIEGARKLEESIAFWAEHALSLPARVEVTITLTVDASHAIGIVRELELHVPVAVSIKAATETEH